MSGRFSTLTFERSVDAPAATLWQAWTAPAARAVWSAPSPSVTVEYLEADTRVGGQEVSLCKVDGQPDIRCEVGWLHLQPPHHSVNYEVVSAEGVAQSAALVTADVSSDGEGSRLVVTVDDAQHGLEVAARVFGIRSASVIVASGSRTTSAVTSSPQSSSGMPMTATSWIFGWWKSASSTSMDETFSPPEMITSFLRSVITT